MHTVARVVRPQPRAQIRRHGAHELLRDVHDGFAQGVERVVDVHGPGPHRLVPVRVREEDGQYVVLVVQRDDGERAADAGSYHARLGVDGAVRLGW